jgi:hypothetical protein
MAYFSQEQKKAMAPKMKALLKRYGMKGSLSVRHHSTVILTLKSGDIDFGDAQSVNVYWTDTHFADRPQARDFLKQAIEILKGPDYFDKSDSQTDYFCRSHYYDINLGTWDKPYVCTAQLEAA